MIRSATPQDAPAVARLMCALWPDHSMDEMLEEAAELLKTPESLIALWEEEGRAEAFAQCGLRHDYVEGTETSPVGYLEGVYVSPALRHRGVARTLVDCCADWARKQGCAEFASDCELDNADSLAFHLAVGFTEANRIICFTKKL